MCWSKVEGLPSKPNTYYTSTGTRNILSADIISQELVAKDKDIADLKKSVKEFMSQMNQPSKSSIIRRRMTNHKLNHTSSRWLLLGLHLGFGMSLGTAHLQLGFSLAARHKGYCLQKYISNWYTLMVHGLTFSGNTCVVSRIL